MPRQDLRRLAPTAQAALRQRAVQLVLRGQAQTAVATVFGVCKQVMSRWVCRYRHEGPAACRVHKRGRPRAIRLKPYQAATIVRLITDRCPDQLKLPFVLWTREAVRDLITRQCGLRLSVWTVGRYLARWGFTPQKPIRRAYEQDPEAVRRWLRAEYPAIRRLAHRERAEIHWVDEMGLRSDHQAGTSYGRRGQTPVIPGTGKRFRCNVISAITNRGKLAFMVFEERFTAAVFIGFLRRLRRQRRRNLVVIADRHPAHIAHKVERWVKRQRRWLHLFFLPGYSPELNPDELLNQDVKTNAVGRRRPHTLAHLKGNVRRFLWSTQRRPRHVRNYFHAPHVRYAAT